MKAAPAAPAVAKPVAPPRAVDPNASRRLKKVEASLAETQAALERIEAQLSDPAVYGEDGGIEVGQLSQRQSELAAEKDRLEAEWLALYETAG